jgi:AraC family cel operon transcriptional repressor
MSPGALGRQSGVVKASRHRPNLTLDGQRSYPQKLLKPFVMIIHKLRLSEAVLPGQHGTYAEGRWNESERSGMHYHDYYEVFWVEEGLGYHWINRQKREIKPGMLVLIRPEDTHCFSAPVGGMLRIINLAFFPSSWKAIQRRYFPDKTLFFASKPLEAREYYLDNAKLLEVRQAARDFEGGARDKFTIERFLLNLFAILQSQWLLSELNLIPQWLLRASEEIRHQKNFEGGTLLFAKLAGRDPSHVARACRKYLKKTPTEIVNDARMAFAANRLLTTDDAILDIALDCGLQNLGHFYRLFHAKYGFSPYAYRHYQASALHTLQRNAPHP